MKRKNVQIQADFGTITENISIYDLVAIVRVGHGGEDGNDAVYNVEFAGGDVVDNVVIRDILQINHIDVTSTLNLGDDSKHDRVLADVAFRKTKGQKFHEPKEFYGKPPVLRLWVGPGDAELTLWVKAYAFSNDA